jgi:alkanesulfonate monooxygenase SsuD/methylene tetrahydromethanopterin reductase-like flavin-dependent oxidoreductase (luciferase family)
MKRLWTDAVSEYHGELYDLAPCRMYPKPVQHPHPPIHVGGESDAALRRVARAADGWHGFKLTPAEAGDRVARLTELLEAEGRARADVEVTIGTYVLPVHRAALDAYAAAGVDQVVVLDLAATVDDVHRALDRLADELVTPAAAL